MHHLLGADLFVVATKIPVMGMERRDKRNAGQAGQQSGNTLGGTWRETVYSEEPCEVESFKHGSVRSWG